MSLTDPFAVTVSAVPYSLPRVSVGDDESEYSNGDGTMVLKASHDYGKRTRRMVRIDTSKITSDPFRPTENVKVSMSNYIVFDLPPAGYTATEAKALWDGFVAALQASSGAVIVKLLGGES